MEAIPKKVLPIVLPELNTMDCNTFIAILTTRAAEIND